MRLICLDQVRHLAKTYKERQQMEIAQINLLTEIGRGKAPSINQSALPALENLTKTVSTPGAVRSVLVAHVLHTAIRYIEIIDSIYPIHSVVAVPYSADSKAVEKLRQMGIEVILPDSVPDTFVKAFQQTRAALEADTTPLMVQEVGGYLAKYIKELSSFPHFLGAVEDTNNGHWRYEQHEPHDRPIISMAQSPLKDVEDTIIGDAVVYSIERVLREENSAILQGSRCGVLGFGKIGTSTAIGLKGREAVVSIYDINPSKNMRAKVEGFFPLPLYELLNQCDLIVGATGQTSIRLVDMEHIKNGAVLVSASSKNIEFALDDFESNCVSIEQINEVTRKYTQNNGKHFYVFYNGTPINFRDKSILGTILDMIYSELFVCMRELTTGKYSNGLHHSPPHIQDEVAKAWLMSHSPSFSSHIEDKIWDYPESLKLGMPKK